MNNSPFQQGNEADEGAEGKAESSAPPTPQYDTKAAADALRGAITSAIGPVGERLDRLESVVAQFLQSQQPGTTKKVAEAGAKAILAELLEDPGERQVFNETLRSVIVETVGPYMQAILPAAQTTVIDKQRERVDKRFGAGTWDEVVSPRLSAILSDKQFPEHLKASPAHLAKVVDTILGDDELEDELSSRRQKAKEAARQRPPSWLGNPSRTLGARDDEDADISAEDEKLIEAISKSARTALTKDDIIKFRKGQPLAPGPQKGAA